MTIEPVIGKNGDPRHKAWIDLASRLHFEIIKFIAVVCRAKIQDVSSVNQNPLVFTVEWVKVRLCHLGIEFHPYVVSMEGLCEKSQRQRSFAEKKFLAQIDEFCESPEIKTILAEAIIWKFDELTTCDAPIDSARRQYQVNFLGVEYEPKPSDLDP